VIIEVARAELSDIRVVDDDVIDLEEDGARLRIDHFGLSSNNITYAVYGDAMAYWAFFPVEGPWGRIPVWGFAEVVETRSAHLRVGERLFGYYPMGAELVITAGAGNAQAVVDTAPHRAAMAKAYSRYARCASDPLYRADREREQLLLYPLFVTSFLIVDLLDDAADFGAEQVVVSSASSKTAIGVAHCGRRRGTRTVGLTSAANVGFVRDLGVYDEVRAYEDIDALARVPAVFVDIAGNADVRLAAHRHLVDDLRYSMTVGNTHWDHDTEVGAEPLPGPAPEFFFAPGQIAKRNEEWGRGELDRRIAEAWHDYAGWAGGWVDFREVRGAEAVTEVYRELLAGRPDPRTGFICSLAAS
jgi:hypothetical protein